MGGQTRQRVSHNSIGYSLTVKPLMSISELHSGKKKPLNNSNNPVLTYHTLPAIDECNVRGSINNSLSMPKVRHASELGQFCSKAANGGVQ